jgi:hypothetical protein
LEVGIEEFLDRYLSNTSGDAADAAERPSLRAPCGVLCVCGGARGYSRPPARAKAETAGRFLDQYRER